MTKGILCAGIVLLAMATQALGQQDCGWAPLWNQGPTERRSHKMVYDSGRNVTVLYGGIIDFNNFIWSPETWEWDGLNWYMVSDGAIAPDVIGGLAYDSGRAVTIALEQADSTGTRSRTWEWDGQSWTMVAENGPIVSMLAQMVYCESRGVIVLYAGAYTSETWEWDGQDWTKVADIGPPATEGFAVAYDSNRDVVVLFGGDVLGGGTKLDETWEWDGNTWTQMGVTGPSPRSYMSMAFDSVRSRTVLFGGYDSQTVLGDTWEWDGQQWTRASENGPSARFVFDVAFDNVRGEMVLFGGNGGKTLADTWAWDGSEWKQRDSFGPDIVSSTQVVYNPDDGTALFFGGYNSSGEGVDETWLWDGSLWTHLNVFGPSPRVLHSMTYDARRHVYVLFGGLLHGRNGAIDYFGDTWEFDGNNWTQVSTSGPLPRAFAAMTFDGRRQVSVLVGGKEDNCSFRDTWEWDGQTWKQKTSVSIPKYAADLSFQESNGTIFMYSGNTDCGGNKDWDMWEWDGFNWDIVTVPFRPPPMYYGAECFDSKRNRLVRYGGFLISHSGVVDEMWAWDGKRWANLSNPLNPGRRSSHSLVYDKQRDRIISFFGGVASPIGRQYDMWEWSCSCYADCDQSTGAGQLDIFDFLCFQNSFTSSGSYACECDTSTGSNVCDVFDFLCFQTAFVSGCQ